MLPLANSFLSAQRARDQTPEPRYPLRMFYCNECKLIQLLDIVNVKEMFDDYAFLTATANTSLIHFDEYAGDLINRLELKGDDLVVDIGSNDGTLLKAFKRHGVKILGVEPARNIANRAIADGVNTLNEYFGAATVEKIGGGKARVITANNVVSHVPDLNGFVASVESLLARNGMFVFEVPWIVDVLRHNNFDIVYHEHLSYFGFEPLSRVLTKHGLQLIGLEYFPKIHGGTFRALAAHSDIFPSDARMLDGVFRDEETMAGFRALEQFASRMQEFRGKLMELLESLKREGKEIVGYGAPAKATILLNYCGIDTSILDFVIDNTPLKQGRFIPGVRIPIVHPNEFSKAHPDYTLLLAWNFGDEIMAKEHDYLKSGGKFIIPFPEPRVVGWDSWEAMGSTRTP
jgi:SAM-dependent methyltransferase